MLISVVLLVAACICYIFHVTKGILWGRNRQSSEPPIVPGHFLWGNGKEFNENSVGFLLKSQKKYGSVFSIRMLHYYMTVIADPHSFEAFSRERSFDFDPIQEQVNSKIFGFRIPESRNMIKHVGKTTRGSAVPRSLQQFSTILNATCRKLDSTMNQTQEWRYESLDHLTNNTLFQTIFNSIFGADKESTSFNYKLFHENFQTFHKYFSYLWLGLPHCLFPEATRAMANLSSQPTTSEFMKSEHTSEYLKAAIQYLQSYNTSETDIKSHNLVFLHININTVKIAFWCMYQLMADKAAMAAVQDEVEALLSNSTAEDGQVSVSAKDIETLPVLDSLLCECFRMASGVFMIRHNQQDTEFKVTATGESYKIRAGDKVIMYPPAIHMDPEIFEQPEVFKYDRFIEQTFHKNGQQLKTPVLPFGSLCPGRRIALLQTKLYIITMINKYNFKLLDGESTTFDTSYPGHEIVPPTNDVQLAFCLRPNRCEIVVHSN